MWLLLPLAVVVPVSNSLFGIARHLKRIHCREQGKTVSFSDREQLLKIKSLLVFNEPKDFKLKSTLLLKMHLPWQTSS